MVSRYIGATIMDCFDSPQALATGLQTANGIGTRGMQQGGIGLQMAAGRAVGSCRSIQGITEFT